MNTLSDVPCKSKSDETTDGAVCDYCGWLCDDNQPAGHLSFCDDRCRALHAQERVARQGGGA